MQKAFLFTRLQEIALAIGVLMCGIGCGSTHTSAQGIANPDPPRFAAGEWFKADEVKALTSRTIPQDFEWTFNTAGFRTWQDSGGQRHFAADGVLDKHGPLNACKEGWCLRDAHLLSFQIEGSDTVALLQRGPNVPAQKYLRVTALPGEIPNGYLDGPFRSLYFAGTYRCYDAEQDTHTNVTMRTDGKIEGHPQWTHYTVQTQHQKPLLFIQHQDGSSTPYFISTSAARQSGFRLMRILNPDEVRDGEGSAVTVGAPAYDFDRR